MWSTFDRYLYGMAVTDQHSKTPIVWVPLEPISDPQNISSLKNIFARPHLRTSIAVMNGHPRSLELLSKYGEMARYAKIVHLLTVWADNRSTLDVMKSETLIAMTEQRLVDWYEWDKLKLNENEMASLLSAITFGEPVSATTPVHKRQTVSREGERLDEEVPVKSVLWQDLMAHGLLLQAFTKEERAPSPHFLLIKCFLEKQSQSQSFLGQTTSTLNRLWLDLHASLTAVDGDSTVFERFHIQLEAVRGHLLCERPLKTTTFLRNDQIGTASTLETRYSGALFYPEKETNPRFISYSGARVHIGQNSVNGVCRSTFQLQILISFPSDGVFRLYLQREDSSTLHCRPKWHGLHGENTNVERSVRAESPCLTLLTNSFKRRKGKKRRPSRRNWA
jgi:hypothetical protein